MAEIHGPCQTAFNPIREILRNSFDRGEDIGASAAVFIDGEAVVDIWGGHIDSARTRPWQRDTIVNMFSTTKTMTALCALILADRGDLDFDAPVARYWPEFAAEGKTRWTRPCSERCTARRSPGIAWRSGGGPVDPRS
jgi:CubicO group peptidase (beta-lactamase class C family)